MGAFTKVVHFKSDNGEAYYADLGDLTSETPLPGSQITAYKSFEELLSGGNTETVTVKEVRTASVANSSMKSKITYEKSPT